MEHSVAAGLRANADSVEFLPTAAIPPGVLFDARKHTAGLNFLHIHLQWSSMAEPSRRFPPPWQADTIPGGYVVRDANGQALAYLYCDNDAEARQAKVLTKDEARRIAIKHRAVAGAAWEGRAGTELFRAEKRPVEGGQAVRADGFVPR
jgi:hypothetical protein